MYQGFNLKSYKISMNQPKILNLIFVFDKILVLPVLFSIYFDPSYVLYGTLLLLIPLNFIYLILFSFQRNEMKKQNFAKFSINLLILFLEISFVIYVFRQAGHDIANSIM